VHVALAQERIWPRHSTQGESQLPLITSQAQTR
jgi:hypothetical protein